VVQYLLRPYPDEPMREKSRGRVKEICGGMAPAQVPFQCGNFSAHYTRLQESLLKKENANYE
jgi:hypothetical protein